MDFKKKSVAKQNLLDSTTQCQMNLGQLSKSQEKEVMTCGFECFGKSLRIEEEFDLGILVWVGIKYVEKMMRSF